jgi:hypothetical protein
MKVLHYLNAALWVANALCWALYAHVPLMGIGSLAVAAATVWLGVTEND